MTIRTFSRWMAVAVCAGTITAMVPATVEAADDRKVCELLTASELESLFGAKVVLKSDGRVPGGKTVVCTGQAPTAAVMVRLVTGLDQGRDRSGSKEMKGIEVAKQMGAQVDVKTFGPITCSTIIPSESLAAHGFNTTCTVSKETAVAGIEVQTKSQKDMISIDRLRPLAEKMAGRF